LFEVVIVGGGVAGLSAAFCAKQKGVENFCLLERNSRLGGCIETYREGVFVGELGPSSLRMGAALEKLCKDLGLDVLLANPKAKRPWLHSEDKLQTPWQLLSWQSKFRLASEIFSNKSIDDDEISIYNFFSERFGIEFTDKVIWAMLTGIYAGDPRKLSMKAIFPELYSLTRQHGSLVRSLLMKYLTQRSAPKKLCSIQGGIEVLIEALSDRVGQDKIQLSAEVHKIQKDGSVFQLEMKGGDVLQAKKVILATPSHVNAKLNPQWLSSLAAIPYNKIITAVCSISSHQLSGKVLKDIRSSLGFLGSRSSQSKLLGVLYSSSMFPVRYQPHEIVITCFLGGIKNPELLELTDAQLQEVILAELQKLYGVSWSLRAHRRWHKAIPQYMLDHQKLINNLELPEGLSLIGNYLRGVSLEDTVKSAFTVLDKVLC